jgi:hypothetical protein
MTAAILSKKSSLIFLSFRTKSEKCSWLLFLNKRFFSAKIQIITDNQANIKKSSLKNNALEKNVEKKLCIVSKIPVICICILSGFLQNMLMKRYYKGWIILVFFCISLEIAAQENWIMTQENSYGKLFSGIDSDPSNKTLILKQNYPNPFKQKTFIEFYIPFKSNVELITYTILGTEYEKLLETELECGWYKFEWVPMGIQKGAYFYRLHFGNAVLTKQARFYMN